MLRTPIGGVSDLLGVGRAPVDAPVFIDAEIGVRSPMPRVPLQDLSLPSHR